MMASLWIVTTPDFYYGPFASAEGAATWMLEVSASLATPYHIDELRSVESPEVTRVVVVGAEND